MELDIQTILTIATGVIAGASIILKAIAPYTKTEVDNKVAAFLVKVLEVLSLHVDKKQDPVVVEVKAK